MKTRQVIRYLCEHCNKGYWEKKGCLRHESLCLKNPDRNCMSCKDLDVMQRPLSFYTEEDTVPLWYFDTDKLRDFAQGCPLCMLAAKIAVDAITDRDERWRDFDYKAEVERVRVEKFGDIPF